MDLNEKEKRMSAASSSHIKTAVFATAALSVICAAVLSCYNGLFIGSDMLYSSKAPAFLPIAALVLAISAAVAGSITLRREKGLNALPEIPSLLFQILSCLLCAAFLAVTVLYLVSGPHDITGGNMITEDFYEKMKIPLLCYMIYAIISPLAAMYFLMPAFGKKQTSALFGCITVSWLLLYLVRLYFDVSDMVMAPRKLTVIFAVCMAILFIISEIRFSLARGSSRKYFVYGSLTSVSCISSGVAGAVSALAGIYPTSFDLSYYVLITLIGIYALARLFSLVSFFGKTTKKIGEEE